MKKILAGTVIAMLAVGLLSAGFGFGRPRPEKTEAVILHFFWSEGCPFCLEQKNFLEQIKPDFPFLEIRDYEANFNQANRAKLNEMAARHGLEPRGTPITFIGDRYFIGFDPDVGQEIVAWIEHCRQHGCPEPT